MPASRFYHKAGVWEVGVLLFGSLTGLLGLGIGAAAGSDETIPFDRMSETEIRQALTRLRGMARLRNVE